MTTIDLNGTSIEVDSGVTVFLVAPDERQQLLRGRDDVVRPLPPAEVPESLGQRQGPDAAGGDHDIPEEVTAAETRLEAARTGVAAARRALEQARNAHERIDQESRRSVAAGAVEDLQKERVELEARRIEILARRAAAGELPDPKPVREALDGLKRLRDVKPKPSSRAIELADRWTAARRRLGELPQPPAPPEWLVTPALAALQEARDALAEAERATGPEAADPAKVDAVERAHRAALDAEQRVMAKASRGNRKRLDQAMAAEREALAAIGAASYGDYLQRVAPTDGPDGEDRVRTARAALADAEAVWEELHGGEASPEYTAAKEEQAAVRAEAAALLGEDISDDQLERRLRAHLEAVDTEPAERRLAEALAAAGAEVEGHLEQWASSWLDAIPAQQQQHAEIDAALAAVDERLAGIDADLADQQGRAFFGDQPAGSSPQDAETALQAALEQAESTEREAVEALAAAREREEALRTARAAAAATAATGTRAPSSVESDAWFVARFATLMTNDSGPVLVDARAAASPRAKRSLEKAAARRPIVILGDDGDVVSWAEGLGDRATVRSI